ncbi:hypothetical protein HOD75_01500 [archaeon]|jgi:hypothetical protein|nr:hypothetical protein [archaeon]MBT4417575.1 hypothetical protein [archaeon]
MDINDLIEEYGEAKEIPDYLLERAGYENVNGVIMPLGESAHDDYSGDEMRNHELYDEDGNWDFENAEREREADREMKKLKQEAKDRLKEEYQKLLKPVKKFVSNDLKKELNEGLKKWFKDTFPGKLDDLAVIDAPQIRFLHSVNDFAQGRPELPREWGIKIIDRAAKSYFTGWYYENGVYKSLSDDYFADQEEQFLQAAREDFNFNEIPENITRDFEKKYGPRSFSSQGPFMSYVFRRIVIGEKDPAEFWGRELFDLREKFIERYNGFEDLENLADFIYSEGHCQGESVLNYNDNLKEDLKDHVPKAVEEFEEGLASGEGIALSLIANEAYLPDDYSLYNDNNLRNLLEKIQRYERPEIFERKIPDKYSYLEELVGSKSKRKKLIMLADIDSGFEEHLKAKINRDREYVARLPENEKITEELEELGVDCDRFYNGIPVREFVFEDGASVSPAEIKERFLAEYRSSLEHIFDGEVVHGAERLEKKIIDTLKKKEIEVPDKEQRKYLFELQDEDSLKRVCNVCSEYASKPQNVKDSQRANASVHHFRSVNRFLRGDKEVDEKTSNKYSIKVSSKDPIDDVDIGNDGGCCIGIYEDEQTEIFEYEKGCVDRFEKFLREGVREVPEITENGIYMPFYLKDRATQFAEIYRGNDRIGMALMFAGKNERDESVLLVNSIEASDKLKRDSHYGEVLLETISFIRDYAEQSNFQHCLMSDHSYNPARDHAGGSPDFTSVQKIHSSREEFYSDALNEKGKGNTVSWKRL